MPRRANRFRRLGPNPASFTHFSLAQGAAALALWPPNADRHAALGRLVDEIAACDVPEGREPILGDEWRRWLTSRASTRLKAIQPDGLHDAPLSAPVALLGVRHALIGGDLEFPELHYSVWMKALDEVLSQRDDPALRRALELLSAVAQLSTQLVTKAELGCFPWPDHTQESEIGVPDDDVHARLREALSFAPEEFGGALDRGALAPLLRKPESPPMFRPLIEGPGQTLLIADPWRLTQAGLVHAYPLAAQSPNHADLLRAIEARSLEVAAEAARDMDWEVETHGRNALLARADVDCQILIGVEVLAPCPAVDQPVPLHAPADLTRCYEDLAQSARSLGAQHSLLAVLGDARGLTVATDHPVVNATQSTDPWLLNIPELRLLGDALRRDPLALPMILEQVPRPPWPENFDLVDYVGILRRREEGPTESDPPEDPTEYMHRRARVMAARHPAPRADRSGWDEVSRWAGSVDSALFCVNAEWGAEGFSLLVRMPGRSLWVTSADRQADAQDLSVVLCGMFAFWLARLFERDWPVVPESLEGIELLACFRVELSDAVGPALALASEPGAARLIAGPGFIEALCRPDNSADRMLISLALNFFGGAADSAQAEILEELAPLGRGTAVLWPDPKLRRNPPSPPAPPAPTERDRLAVEIGLAASLLSEEQVAVISGEPLRPALLDLIARVDSAIKQQLSRLQPDCLVKLVALHECATHHAGVEAITLPARVELAELKENLDSQDSIGERDMVLRALVERVAADPPTGEEPLGLRSTGWLRAATRLQLQLLGALDVIENESVGARLVVSPRLGVAVELEGPLPNAGRHLSRQIRDAAPELMVIEHEVWWGEELDSVPPPDLSSPMDLDDNEWLEVNIASAEEWGVSFEQQLRILRALSDMAEEEPGSVRLCRRRKVVEELGQLTAISEPVLKASLERLTLGPIDDHDVTALAHHPGRPNRERSYVRRPLVEVEGGDLAWSSQHTLKAARYLLDLVRAGRLRGGSPLKAAVGRVSQRLDRDFEQALCERAEALGWRARLRVRSMGGVALERRRGEEIGDIDVLAWHPQRRKVWLLDAKRLAPGLAPHSMIREGESLVHQSDHHQERLDWVRAHRKELAVEIDDDYNGAWEIEAAMVLDRPIAGAHLAPVQLPVCTYRELGALLNRGPSE